MSNSRCASPAVPADPISLALSDLQRSLHELDRAVSSRITESQAVAHPPDVAELVAAALACAEAEAAYHAAYDAWSRECPEERCLPGFDHPGWKRIALEPCRELSAATNRLIDVARRMRDAKAAQARATFSGRTTADSGPADGEASL